MPEGPEHHEPSTDRESPVGKPVIRGDPQFTGEHAHEAVEFDPDDPESLELAAETVHRFAENTAGAADNVYILRGAAACAALVRGEGSYKAAAERAGGEATVSFIRKWSRVHDLPRSIRVHVARGEIAPSAAKHIARVAGESRLLLAWAALDHDLTVRRGGIRPRRSDPLARPGRVLQAPSPGRTGRSGAQHHRLRGRRRLPRRRTVRP